MKKKKVSAKAIRKKTYRNSKKHKFVKYSLSFLLLSYSLCILILFLVKDIYICNESRNIGSIEQKQNNLTKIQIQSNIMELDENTVAYLKIQNTYIVKFPVNQIIIYQHWYDKSWPANFVVYDKNWNLLMNITSTNISLSGNLGKIYIKRTFTGHFMEGGIEKRYTWFLVELYSSALDDITFNFSTSPYQWPEDPFVTWNNAYRILKEYKR